MHLRIGNVGLIGTLAAICGQAAFAGPADFKLLPLIPPGAQLVAGFEARQNQYKTGSGSLLLITVNNVLDLQDWVAISGVDPKRTFKEVVHVSLAHPGETLSEHLLLISGTFDSKRIFRSAELNGAQPFKYLAEPVLSIEAFERERMETQDTRWLAILEDHIVVFGTPSMVQQALNRFEHRVPADPALINRLILFNPDVSCWNLMTSMPKTSQDVFLDSLGPWSTVFEDAELLMVGVHADSNVRVDLSVITAGGSERADSQGKVTQFAQIFGTFVREGDRKRGLRNLEVKKDRIQASILLSGKDFIAWSTGQSSHNNELRDVAREVKERLASTSPPTMSALPQPAH